MGYLKHGSTFYFGFQSFWMNQNSIDYYYSGPKKTERQIPFLKQMAVFGKSSHLQFLTISGSLFLVPSSKRAEKKGIKKLKR